MSWKQLVAMGGVFYLTFISLRICCPAGDKFVIVAVSAFFTFLVVKSFVYTLEMWKAKKAGVDIWAELRKGVEGIKNKDTHIYYNLFYLDDYLDNSGYYLKDYPYDDNDSHGNPIWPEDER